MKRILALASCLLTGSGWIAAQNRPAYSAQEITDIRVGKTFDARELDYFGLFYSTSELVDSARCGRGYIDAFSKGKARRISLTDYEERQFYNFIADYEKYALSPELVSAVSIAKLNLRLPLVVHEQAGVQAELVVGEASYFGTVAFVTAKYLGLYELDLAYEPELAETELRILPIASIEKLSIYSRKRGRYTGLGIGAILALGANVAGANLFSQSTETGSVITNAILFPAAGFGIGYAVDKLGILRTTYTMADSQRALKALQRARKYAMFPLVVPPEIEHRLPPAP